MTSAFILRGINSVEMPKIVDRHAFVAWLQFMHGLIRASERLLEIAITKSDGKLREYYAAHLGEEKHHAEWLAQDLDIIGEKPVRIDQAPAAVAGAQYYYLDHVGPQPLLGYMAALEFRPMPLAIIERLEQTYGAPALRTVRHHAERDPDHAKELARVIDQHEEFASLISYSAFVTAKMVAFYLNERMAHA